MSFKNALKGISLGALVILMTKDVYSTLPKTGDLSSTDQKPPSQTRAPSGVEGIKAAFYERAFKEGLTLEQAQALLEMRRRQLMPDSLVESLTRSSSSKSSH